MRRTLSCDGRTLFVLACLMAMVVQVCMGKPRLARPGSTHPSFPLDAFARPAYKVIFQDDQPIGNQTALEILRASRSNVADQEGSQDVIRGTYGSENANEQQRQQRRPFKAYLHRTSPQKLHVCTLAETKQLQAKKVLELDEKAMDDYRAGVLRRALALLAPLKTGCLFHTHDWFTYSFCHGDALRQFHALPSTLGGGKIPAMDPTQDSYVLGRWKAEAETVHASSISQTGHDTRTVGDASGEVEVDGRLDDTVSGHLASAALDQDQAGTQLMELVHFSSIEDVRPSSVEQRTSATSGSSTVEEKGRYISQVWTDGTLCNINNEPRSTEVQFHCAKSPPVDRIALIKEVTTCNYVVVIETPRLCEEPALAQVEDEVEEIHCRPILSDEALHQRFQQHVRDTHASLIEGAKQADDTAAETKSESETLSSTSSLSDQPTDRSSFEAQLHSVFEKLTKTKLSGESSAMEDVEVVVGMDEDGNFILEPRSDSTRSTYGSSQESDGELDSEQFYDTSDSLSDGKEASSDSVLSVENVAEIVQRIKDMGLFGSEGALIKIVQGDEEIDLNERINAQAGDVLASDGTAASITTGDQTAAGRAGQPAQRGNMMVRETETFAQRVDRLYRAQEEAAAKSQSKQQEGDAGDDKEKGKRDSHVEL